MNHAQFWGGAAAAPYEIEQSLRFRGGAEVSRGVSSLSANTTFSAWFKLGHSSNDFHLLNFDQSGTNRLQIKIEVSSGGYIRACTQGSCSNSSALFRDYSGWYHVVIQTTSSATNVYVNNVLALTRSQPASGTNGLFIETGFSTSDSSGYVAEAYFVDGSALAPTTFAEEDDNGVWRPIEVTGLTYGTNGFYLKFDPSATNGIGHDYSGNGNNYNVSGFTTSGTGTDVMSDTPTTNWCTWNPLDGKRDDGSYSYPNDGNLYTRVDSQGNYAAYGASIGFLTSGKWYFEYVPVRGGNNADDFPKHKLTTKDFIDSSSSPTGLDMLCGTQDGDGGTYMVAIDMDNGYVYRGRNGTWSNSGDPTSGSSGTGNVASFTVGTPYRLTVAHRFDTGTSEATHNFGQRAFSYTVPTGYSTLNTSNLPAPDIADGSDYFNTVIYTGASPSDQAVTGVGFQPDFTWIKARTQAYSHALYDAVRGATKELHSDTTDQEDTDTNGLKSFDSDGFTVGSDGEVGDPTGTRVSWNWLAGGTGSSNTDGSITSTVSANPTAGFSIVSYTGTQAAATVGHGLGVAPSLIIARNRDSVKNWRVQHASLGPTKYLSLNLTDAAGTASSVWNNTAPTSTVFSVADDGGSNGPSNGMVAYCFAEVEGYSKFGSYTGNGNSSEGPFVFCGFKPAMVIYKNASTTSDWTIVDSARSSYNEVDIILDPSNTTTEGGFGTTNRNIDFLSNGFKIRSTAAGGTTALNGSSNTMLFMAFAEHPFGGSGVSPATAR